MVQRGVFAWRQQTAQKHTVQVVQLSAALQQAETENARIKAKCLDGSQASSRYELSLNACQAEKASLRNMVADAERSMAEMQLRLYEIQEHQQGRHASLQHCEAQKITLRKVVSEAENSVVAMQVQLRDMSQIQLRATQELREMSEAHLQGATALHASDDAEKKSLKHMVAEAEKSVADLQLQLQHMSVGHEASATFLQQREAEIVALQTACNETERAAEEMRAQLVHVTESHQCNTTELEAEKSNLRKMVNDADKTIATMQVRMYEFA